MRSSLVRLAAFVIAAATYRPALSAQQPASTPVSTSALNVFLDCRGNGCDFDFFRTEISSVNWVRDRAVADVHILVSTQETGAGGTSYDVAFLGTGRFAGMGDTLTYATAPTTVQDEARKGLAQVLRVGLVRFVARASGYERMTISFGSAAKAAAAQPQRDRWNFWVFEASLGGFTDGDKTSKFFASDGELNARRVTEQWKTGIGVGGNYNQSEFELSEGETFRNIQRNYNIEFEQVKSLGSHFSVGITGGMGSSTFSNQKRVTKIAPALEYDVFPYQEATRRHITFQYAVGYTHYVYEDTTVFLKIREGIPVHQIRGVISARQPWGNVSLRTLFRSQLADPSKRRGSVGGSMNVRIVRGLSINFGGNISSIHDQINLRLEEATDEEILVRQRERATSYRYNANFGVSYTFGSIFNNVVNPRFNIGDFF
jgi:hypothetical protein